MGDHPYADLDARAFWRPAVAGRHALDISDLYDPGFALTPDTPVATFGSCFARHFGPALAARGYAWIDAEPAPVTMSGDSRRAFGYGLFSARTGNVYTAAAMRQWLGWALGHAAPPAEFWCQGGRWYDPFRPDIEPGGFASRAEAEGARRATLAALRRVAETAGVLVFTLGLTEAWRHARTGHEYPVCPGTAAGRFDPGAHVFVNHAQAAVRRDLATFIGWIRRVNRACRVVLTVSPVPLAATAAGGHVLVATGQSKATLRSAAGEVAAALPMVDYFPAYEIVAAPPFRAMFHEPDLRGVNRRGVDFVMECFFAGTARTVPDRCAAPPAADDDPFCTEAAHVRP